MLTAYQPHPSEPVRRWVKLIWEWDGYTSTSPWERILPHGDVELSWKLDGAHTLISASGQRRTPHRIHGPALLGARDEPYLVDTATSAHLFGIVFAVGAASSFLGVAADELCGGFFQLSSFRRGAELEARLADASTPDQRRRVVIDTFTSIGSPDNRESVALCAAWADASLRRQSIARIRGELGVTSPTFVRRVQQQTGLRPAQLRQVLMFREATYLVAQANEATANGRRPSLARAALDAGYCDQAHLNRAFRHHAGLTPRHVRPAMPDHPFNLPEPVAPIVATSETPFHSIQENATG